MQKLTRIALNPSWKFLKELTSDLFEENKEVKQQLKEVTSIAESLQSELLESNKTNILLKKKLDEYDLANKRFQECLKKKLPRSTSRPKSRN